MFIFQRLFEKLNEHLKHGAHAEVGALLFSIVRKQVSVYTNS